jgi:hypothetical protein
VVRVKASAFWLKIHEDNHLFFQNPMLLQKTAVTKLALRICNANALIRIRPSGLMRAYL